jgi:hypothetical protein
MRRKRSTWRTRVERPISVSWQQFPYCNEFSYSKRRTVFVAALLDLPSNGTRGRLPQDRLAQHALEMSVEMYLLRLI